MPGLDVAEFYESDSSENEENYSKLLDSISQLDSSQRVKPAQRKEIASEVSEFNLGLGFSSNNNLINVKELTQALGQKSAHRIISKKLKTITEKSRTLPKPLEKPVEERIKRSIGFEKVKEQLRKWDAIVSRNALKEHISFPLNDNSMKMQKSKEFLSQFKTPTPLEEEIAKVLKEQNKEAKEIEEDEFPLTLEEMMEKRKEMAQLRAKLSYRQSKAQRQSKIKSKKYHRVLKREKLRQQLKEFELLQKTDPEAALKKLSELDKSRAQERASLRHRNTGQWAKNLIVRAKYDVETRKILAEQLKVSRELTQKVSQLDSSDDEEPVDSHKAEHVHPNQSTGSLSAIDNPWTLEVSKEVQDFVSGCKKFWNEKGEEINREISDKIEEKKITSKNDAEKVSVIKNGKITEDSQCKNKLSKLKTKSVAEPKVPLEVDPQKAKRVSPKRQKMYVAVHPASGVWVVEPVADESLSQPKKKKPPEDIDTLFDDLKDELMKKAEKKVKNIKKKLKKKRNEKVEKVRKEKSVQGFDLSLKSRNTVERPDLDEGLLEGEFEHFSHNSEIAPTSVAVFEINNSNRAVEPSIDPDKFIQIRPKRLNTHLPDNITGDEAAVDDEKAQRLIIEEAFEEDDVMVDFREMKEEEEKNSKVEIEMSLPGWGKWAGAGIRPNPRKKRPLIVNHLPRKDKNKKDIIINENENPNLINHLVKEVPHPFKSVEAFEANIRAPVGRQWIPETAHQKLIQKQVCTKLGMVIEPMDENEIVRSKKAAKSPYQGKKRKTKIVNKSII